MSESEHKWKRVRERIKLALPVRVHCRESAGHEWTEMSRLVDVTPFGARFPLTRPTERGRLLHLTLPMPRQLRCFDHVEDQYRVWALVRNVKVQPAAEGKPARFEIGVAFIGKRAPQSFELDPTTRYQVASSVTETGMCDVVAEDPASRHVPADTPRPETRHHIPIEVVVEALDEKGQAAARETTVTENISRRGAAVFTTLEADSGQLIRLSSTQYQLAVIAAVRARRPGPDGIMRLHLEFIDREWPLEGVD